jgi:MFS family permease
VSAARSALADRLGAGLGGGFWALLSASFLANLSDGIFLIALPLLAVGLTDEPALVAGVAVASRLPWLVFALIAGALADRFDRRRTMVFVDGARALILAGLTLAVATGTASIWLLYLVAFVLGCLETMFDTAANSILPNIVGREKVVPANSRLHAVELTMNQFIGPPVGGFLVAIAVTVAFGAAAAGYLGALLLLLTLRGSFRAERPAAPASFATEIAEGVRYLAHHRLLRTMALVVGPMNLASMAIIGIVVLYAVSPGPLGLDAVGFGLLTTAGGAGWILGTLLASRLERRLGRANLFVACIAGLLAQDLVYVVVPQAVVVGLVLVVTGILGGAFNVVFGSIRQRIVPNHLLGRVMASFRVISWGSLPLGALIGGIVGQTLGLTAVFIGAAAIHLLLLPSRLILTDEFMDQAEAEAEAREAAGAEASAA